MCTLAVFNQYQEVDFQTQNAHCRVKYLHKLYTQVKQQVQDTGELQAVQCEKVGKYSCHHGGKAAAPAFPKKLGKLFLRSWVSFS